MLLVTRWIPLSVASLLAATTYAQVPTQAQVAPHPPGRTSDVRTFLKELTEKSGADITGIKDRVRANIAKRFPKGTSESVIEQQVTRIAQYLAALRVLPEDLDQPPKLSKQDKSELAKLDPSLREAAAKQKFSKARENVLVQAARNEAAAQARDPRRSATLSAPADFREMMSQAGKKLDLSEIFQAPAESDDEPDFSLVKSAEDASEVTDDSSDPRPSKLKLFSRLMDSSLEFIACEDLTDWNCIETLENGMLPTSKSRRDGRPGLGTPVFAGDSLNIQWFFNENWDNKARFRQTVELPRVTDRIGKKILGDHLTATINAQRRGIERPRWVHTQDGLQVDQEQAKQFIPKEALTRFLGAKEVSDIDFAIYGMDDVNERESAADDGQGNSLRKVFEAILSFRAPFRSVRGVVDIAKAENRLKTADNDSGGWLFSYVKPIDHFLSGWFFSSPKTDSVQKNFNGASFQYGGTAELVRQLNWNDPRGKILKDDDAPARMEWSTNNIMHNKFIVFKQRPTPRGRAVPVGVWTGTANFSAHCLGHEQNSNMSLVILDPAIAKAYDDQFDHMFEFANLGTTSPKVRNAFPTGRFHKNKVPISNRFFYYKDGTQVRVHFAPTDDGEHRSTLPMIHSAGPGDTLRISMFGNSGYEYIRALQLAAARGVFVRIVLDAQQAAGAFSWLKDPTANLREPNPYYEPLCLDGRLPGSLDVRVSTWDGKNHYKAASLTRANGVVEAFIVGSQNWSNGGNDGNDENMISIQNVFQDPQRQAPSLRIGRQFNLEFEHLYEASRPVVSPETTIFPPACHQLAADIRAGKKKPR